MMGGDYPLMGGGPPIPPHIGQPWSCQIKLRQVKVLQKDQNRSNIERIGKVKSGEINLVQVKSGQVK